MLLTLSAAAQQLTVKSFAPASQIIAGDDRKTDWNNVPCALIKVQGAEVDSVAGAFDVVRRGSGSELWVYVTNGRRNITLYKRGYEPVTVNFSDYNVEGAESNRVYHLVVSAPVTAQTGQEKTADYLLLTVTPRNATVTIDGRLCSIDHDDGTVSEVLTFGQHNVQVQALGYETVSRTIQFSPANRELRIDLQSQQAEVIITATTPGTVIYVNNEQRGTDHCTLRLTPRTYIIKGEKAGYASQEMTLTVTDASAKRITIPALQQLTGTADINFKPTGSKVYIDGKYVDTSPRIIPNLSVGQHSVEIRNDGYLTYKGTINIEQNKETTLSGKLEQDKTEKAQQRQETPVVERERSVVERERRTSVTEYRRHSSEYVGYEPAFSFGIRAGVNMATTQFKSPYDGAGMVMGFHLGVSADIRLTNGFYFSPALLYSGKGYKYDKDNIDETCSASYITMPLHLSPRFAVGEGVELQVLVGPYIGIAIGGTIDSKTKNEKTDFTKYYNGFDYGASFGLGALFSEHYYVGLGYELGFAEYRNRNISISLGYNF